jgi:hypothetical protein
MAVVAVRVNDAAVGLLQLLGAYLFLDDVDDFPNVDRVHHWQIGAGLMGLPFLLEAIETGEENG